jgi:hypothetical protein
VRYDSRFARAMGKWVLNAANASRLFYPDELPNDRQICPEYKSVAKNLIAYEALVTKDHGRTIFADRDNWDETFAKHRPSNLSLYGSSHVGYFGAIISPTNDENILQLDCLATDFFHKKAYPTYLYFNPHEESRSVQISVGDKPVDLYDSVTHRFVRRNATGTTTFRLAKNTAAVLVFAPTSGKITIDDRKLLVDDVVVDYYRKPGAGK